VGLRFPGQCRTVKKPALAPAYGVMAPVPGVRLIGPRWTTYHWPRQEISEKIPKDPSFPATVL
jgi:hypothetical protein